MIMYFNHSDATIVADSIFLLSVLVILIPLKRLANTYPITSYNNVANIYENKGDYDTALNFYQKSIIILKKVLTWQHPTTKTGFNNYKITLNKVVKIVPNDIIAAHIAFIQAEFSEYLE